MRFKFALIAAFLFLASSVISQNMEYVYAKDEVTFYGLDFSQAKMIGEDFDQPDRIVRHYYKAWNQILLDEMPKYNLRKYLRFSVVDYKLNMLMDRNDLIASNSIRSNSTHRISREKFFEAVQSYDLKESSGMGMAIFVESFNEFKDECSVYYVFFDIASRDLIVIENVRGTTGGVGFRNNWANAVFNTMQKWQRQTYRKKIEDKIPLLSQSEQEKFYARTHDIWSIDDVDHFDRKIEKRIAREGGEVWSSDHYVPLPIPSNTIIRTPVLRKEPTEVKPQTEVISVAKSPNYVSPVDINIPTVSTPKPYRFALIIGNEDYQTYQPTLGKESNVDYANRDAQVFKEYAEKVLGVPQENVVYLLDAKVVEFNRGLLKMNKAIELSNGKAEVFVYYAGHGFPDQNTKDPYIIPVDVSANDLKYAFKLSDIYKSLTQYPSQRITVFLDACFSGGARNQGLMSARGVKIVPKTGYLDGNIMVFTACSGSETAQPYHKEKHGLFTYYLLKKLQESKGEITYEEMYGYLRETVGIKAVFVNESEQTPQVNSSPAVGEEWKKWKFN